MGMWIFHGKLCLVNLTCGSDTMFWSIFCKGPTMAYMHRHAMKYSGNLAVRCYVVA